MPGARVYLIAYLITVLSVGTFPLQLLAQQDETHRKMNANRVVVAVVPFAENVSEELEKKIKSVVDDLISQKGIDVIERKVSQDILGYYLDYVDTNTRDSEFGNLMKGARQAFIDVDYGKAKELADKALNIVEDAERQESSNSGIIDVLTLEAKIAYVQGNSKGVEDSYRRIVQYDPDLKYEADLHSRWEISALKKAKDLIAGVSRASIEISSNPINSDVFLDGVRKGVTLYDRPLIIPNILPGKHCIEVKTIHYKPNIRYVELHGGDSSKITAELVRVDYKGNSANSTVPPSRFNTPQELAGLMSNLGYYLKADKIILVGEKGEGTKGYLDYQVGDTKLGAIYESQRITYTGGEGSISLVTEEMKGMIKKDVLSGRGDQLVSRSVGSMDLHEKRRKPIYKRPLFWILIGLGAAGGGIGAVLLGGGAAASTTGGVIIAL